MQQNESLYVAISVNVNVLSDGKSLNTQGHGRVAHATWRKKLHWSLNRICYSHSSFTFGLCASEILAWMSMLWTIWTGRNIIFWHFWGVITSMILLWHHWRRGNYHARIVIRLFYQLYFNIVLFYVNVMVVMRHCTYNSFQPYTSRHFGSRILTITLSRLPDA